MMIDQEIGLNMTPKLQRRIDIINTCLADGLPTEQFIKASSYEGLQHIFNGSKITLAIRAMQQRGSKAKAAKPKRVKWKRR